VSGEVGRDVLRRDVSRAEDHGVVHGGAPDRAAVLVFATGQERPRDHQPRVGVPSAQLGERDDHAVEPLVRADRAEGEHDLRMARQAEPGAGAEPIEPSPALEESGVAVMNALDPCAGGEPPPRHVRRPLCVDDDCVGGGEAPPERPVVPADALVRPNVVDRHHDRHAAADHGPEQRVEARREQALHVDDIGLRPGQPVPERLHVAEVSDIAGEAAVDLEAARQVPQLPLPVGQEGHLDPRAGERGAQVPRVVRDASPATGLDHDSFHGARMIRDEPSERSRRAHAASLAESTAARCRSRGGYLTTSAAMRESAPRTTAARRIAAAARL